MYLLAACSPNSKIKKIIPSFFQKNKISPEKNLNCLKRRLYCVPSFKGIITAYGYTCSYLLFVVVVIVHSLHHSCLSICRKDARLPVQLQRAMAAEAEAAREARAKVSNRHRRFFDKIEDTFWSCFQVIAAEGEQKASRALREASEVIAESSSALQLRYLQVRSLTAILKQLMINGYPKTWTMSQIKRFRECTLTRNNMNLPYTQWEIGRRKVILINQNFCDPDSIWGYN